jgi:hypothetical protein
MTRGRDRRSVDSDSATTRSPTSKAIVHFSSFVPAEHSQQLDLLPARGDRLQTAQATAPPHVPTLCAPFGSPGS